MGEAIAGAAAAAVWPPALLFVAFLLAAPSPRKRSLAYLAGAVVVTLGVGFAVVLLLNGVGLARNAHPVAHAWIDVGLGVSLVVLAAALVVRPELVSSQTSTQQRRELGVAALFVAGAVMYSPSPFYLAALHSVTREHLTRPGTVATVVLLAAIYMLMIEIPIVLYLVAPERTSRWLDSWNRLLSRYGLAIVIVIAACFGTYLIISGVSRLAG